MVRNHTLEKTHIDSWKEVWNSGRIDLEGNVILASSVYSALYYILSAMPTVEEATWPFIEDLGHGNIPDIVVLHNYLHYYAPKFKEVEETPLLSGCVSVRPSVRPFVTRFDTCHIMSTVHARELKYHIWIPRETVSDLYRFSCPSYCLSGVMPLKNQNEILSARYHKKCFS